MSSQARSWAYPYPRLLVQGTAHQSCQIQSWLSLNELVIFKIHMKSFLNNYKISLNSKSILNDVLSDRGKFDVMMGSFE